MQQKLGLLYKPGSIDSAQLAPHAEIENLIEDWDADVNGDGVLDVYGFTRTPLVVDLLIVGSPLQIIVAHAKSHFINQGRSLWENAATRRPQPRQVVGREPLAHIQRQQKALLTAAFL